MSNFRYGAYIACVLINAFALAICGCALRHPLTTNDAGILSASRTIPVGSVRFKSGSDELSDAALWDVTKNSEWMAKHSDEVVIVEGHCDERGSFDMNLSLGDRRAREVMAAMVSRGVSEERIAIVSYGETRPRDDRHTADAWAKNRRVEFVVR